MPSHTPRNGERFAAPIGITPDLLRTWPLPQPDEGGDKNDRGSVLVVGGTLELPGAVILAATGALRAGAGKLQVATCRSVAHAVAVALPEARVIGLPESPAGGIAASAAGAIAGYANAVEAAVIGPGMVDDEVAQRLLRDLVPRIEGTALVLDAGALACVAADRQILHRRAGKVVLTPHPGEMARMLEIGKDEVTRDPRSIVRRVAAELRAVVVLKGGETYVADPDGTAYCFKSGTIGLATSGSGDTLAGVIAGLLARGAGPIHAAAWGVYLHGTAGVKLAERMGRLGFLARELLAEIPALMADLDAPTGS